MANKRVDEKTVQDVTVATRIDQKTKKKLDKVSNGKIAQFLRDLILSYFNGRKV